MTKEIEITFDERLSRYLKRYANRDYIAYKMPVKTRSNMTEDFQEVDKIAIVCAQDAIDLGVTMKAIEKKGGVPVAGNFPNLKDSRGKIDDRIGELKSAYDHRQTLLGNAVKASKPTIKQEVAKKESAKMAEVKERLAKGESKEVKASE